MPISGNRQVSRIHRVLLIATSATSCRAIHSHATASKVPGATAAASIRSALPALRTSPGSVTTTCRSPPPSAPVAKVGGFARCRRWPPRGNLRARRQTAGRTREWSCGRSRSGAGSRAEGRAQAGCRDRSSCGTVVEGGPGARYIRCRRWPGHIRFFMLLATHCAPAFNASSSRTAAPAPAGTHAGCR